MRFGYTRRGGRRKVEKVEEPVVDVLDVCVARQVDGQIIISPNDIYIFCFVCSTIRLEASCQMLSPTHCQQNLIIKCP